MTTGEPCMTFHRGDVVLVPFPFSDLSATKVRPAVIVSSALYHSAKPDLVLAALTLR
jgi:mRNA interferase MazF